MCHQAAGQITKISCSYHIKSGFLILWSSWCNPIRPFLRHPLCFSNAPQNRSSASARSAADGHAWNRLWSVLSVHCFHHFRFSLLQLLQILLALPSLSCGPSSARYHSVSPGNSNFSLYWMLRAFTFRLETFCSFVHNCTLHFLHLYSPLFYVSLISPRRGYICWRKGSCRMFALLLPVAPCTLFGVRHLEGFPNWD